MTRVGVDDSKNAYEMVWVDRAGRLTPVDTAWRFRVSSFSADHGWALSPDGSRLAIGLFTEAGDDIWVKQLPRGPLSRVSYDPAPEVRPRWTRDGPRSRSSLRVLPARECINTAPMGRVRIRSSFPA